MIRARELVVPLTLVSLAASPARAAGLGGGLEAMRLLAIGLLLLFSVAWIFVWVALRTAASRPPDAEKDRAWPLDAGVPVGLRILAGVQYLLAFLYGFYALLKFVMPSHYTNGRVAGEVILQIAFGACFASLAILSANGYLHRRRSGFTLGIALGLLCVGNGLVRLLLYGRYMLLDPISPLLGIAVLTLLHLRYRPFFEAEEEGPLGHALRLVGRWLLRGSTALGVGLVALMFTSLVFTTLLADDREAARAVLRGVAASMEEYREEHGDWPESLDQLDPSVKRRYRWRSVEYRPDEQRLRMEVYVPLEPDPLYRVSFGMLGYGARVGAVGHRLR